MATLFNLASSLGEVLLVPEVTKFFCDCVVGEDETGIVTLFSSFGEAFIVPELTEKSFCCDTTGMAFTGLFFNVMLIGDILLWSLGGDSFRSTFSFTETRHEVTTSQFCQESEQHRTGKKIYTTFTHTSSLSRNAGFVLSKVEVKE